MPQMLGAPQPFVTSERSFAAGDRSVRTRQWESASGCAPTSQDALVLGQFDGWVRVAVLDGVTPTTATPQVGGLDGAAGAAQLSARALERPVAAPDALRAANAELLAEHGHLLHRDRPHTMAAVADIGGDHVDLTVVGDCQVFVSDGNSWREIFGGPLFAEAAARAWRRWRDEHPDAHPVDGIAAAYERILATPGVWRSTPIGLFVDTHFEHARVPAGACEYIVVATDGARLDDERVADLDRWLDELRDLERTAYATEFKPHDDVAVIHASLACH